MVVVFSVVKFKRNPKVLFDTLYGTQVLAECRDALQVVGQHKHTLDTGARVFVSPNSYQYVLDHLAGTEVVFPTKGERAALSKFHSRFMIVAWELRAAFFAAVKSIRSSGKLQLMPVETAPIVVVEKEEEEEEEEEEEGCSVP